MKESKVSAKMNWREEVTEMRRGMYAAKRCLNDWWHAPRSYGNSKKEREEYEEKLRERVRDLKDKILCANVELTISHMRGCGQCRWWEEVDKTEVGICKRHPQNKRKELMDFCGEWELGRELGELG